jgi:hypothetical protein
MTFSTMTSVDLMPFQINHHSLLSEYFCGLNQRRYKELGRAAAVCGAGVPDLSPGKHK